MLVLAGPGSGKTYVITQRISCLIREKHIDPASILVISFSKAAAEEVKKRFREENPAIPNAVNFSTFHACFFHILKEACHYTPQDIIKPREQIDLIRTILSIPTDQPSYTEELPAAAEAEDYLRKISYYKNRGQKALEEKEEESFQKIFHQYQQMMHGMHKLDFDDMGLLCLSLFQERKDILTFWQEKFAYILIDEMQDINPIQFKLIRLLAGKRQNLFVVGDDDQAIYSFRGASPEIMLNFEKIYPDTKKVLLETNFRCSGNIVQTSLAVIEKNKQRFPKAIRAFHEQGEPVVVQGFPDTEEEYSYLCRQIGSLCEQEAEYSRVCCIYRTNGDMQKLARYLTKERIPFRMKEHCSSVFRHFIALDILSYLQFFREGQKRRDFLVIMNKPLRYLSRKACTSEEVSFQELRNYYRGKGYMQQSIHQLEMQKHWITRLDLYGAVSYIRKVVGYEDYLRKYAKDQGIVWEELEEILDFVHQSTRGINSIAAWKREIAEYEEALAQAGEEREGVWLMTMHACKGLEFPYVFLPDCNEGKTPHKKAVSRAEIEEERRMFYVAMTRAQKKLYILYLADKKKKKLLPSRFLPTIDFPLLR